jgi:hypothetical protein
LYFYPPRLSFYAAIIYNFAMEVLDKYLGLNANVRQPIRDSRGVRYKCTMTFYLSSVLETDKSLSYCIR